jgi:hypothetical protein
MPRGSTWLTVGALGATALLAGVARFHPVVAIVAAAGVLLAAVLPARPDVGFALLLLGVAVSNSDEHPLADLSQVLKVFSLAYCALSAMRFGLRMRFAAPIGAYVLLLGTTVLFGTAPESYSMSKALAALLGFIGYWIPLVVRWPVAWGRRILRMVLVLPVVNAVYALLLFALPPHRPPWWENGTAAVGRWAGATIPPHAAFLCLAALMAAYVLVQRGERRVLGWAAVSYLLLLATLTRGSILGGSIVLLAIVVVRRQESTRHAERMMAGVAVAGVIALAGYGAFVLRVGNGTGAPADSGRTEAWSFLLAHRTDDWFGSGLNSIPSLVSGSQFEDHFKAAHNEYLRALVEYGTVGTVLLVVAVALTAVATVRAARVVQHVRIGVVWVAVALVAVFDNPLSVPVFMLPFATVIAMSVAGEPPGMRRPGVTSPAVEARA